MSAAHDVMRGEARESWDLFCRVVDNFGDIGIAWRLARQLATDPNRQVRLIVDGMASFARIEPRLDAHLPEQIIDGIAIVEWNSLDESMVAQVVVELLGCGLPQRYLDAMAASLVKPSTWIDFEHLSAESWIDGFHGLPSPHPRLPLTKHFFYPGFGAATGGLLIEPDLERQRAMFVAEEADVDALWARLGVAPREAGEMRVSLFAYPDAPVDALIDALASRAGERWTLLVLQGVSSCAAGTRGALTIVTIPFVDQDTYDRVLWACDFNFVRGEDSFVRAQVAGCPFVWQIYRQPDAVHLAKLAAFELRYEVDLDVATRAAQRRLWSAWNGVDDGFAEALEGWIDAQPRLRVHAERWRLRLAATPPLVDRLIRFVDALQDAPRGSAGLLD